MTECFNILIIGVIFYNKLSKSKNINQMGVCGPVCVSLVILDGKTFENHWSILL